jgi:ATP-dependent DNA helicase PIF1
MANKEQDLKKQELKKPENKEQEQELKKQRYDNKVNELFSAIDEGRNVLIHSPGGTGKTYMLGLLHKYMQDVDTKIWFTALTGAAAVCMAEYKIIPKTLHSWAGVGLAKGDTINLIRQMELYPKSKARWTTTDILVIDEISMLGDDLMDKLDEIGRIMRNKPDIPFGGIQLILCGDFLQLQPVNAKFAFKSKVWKELNIKMIELDEPQRYADQDYFMLLNRARMGFLTNDDHKKLYKQHLAYLEYKKAKHVLGEIAPTIVFSKRMDVEKYNIEEMNKLPGSVYVYNAQDRMSKLVNTIQNATAADDDAETTAATKMRLKSLLEVSLPTSLSLKVGAQVMLKVNIDTENGLVNGSRGVVINMASEFVAVKFKHFEDPVAIPYSTYDIDDRNYKLTRRQIPLILAWATTIHSSQGSTLDYAIVDIGKQIFCPAQAYVAMSRVKSLESMLISDFEPSIIKPSSIALKYVLLKK